MNPLELPHRAATAVGGLKDLTLNRLGMLTPSPRKGVVFPAANKEIVTEVVRRAGA